MLSMLTNVQDWVLPDSSDNLPLITKVSDLSLSSFPYHRLPLDHFGSLFLQPEVVVGALLFYIFLSKPFVGLFTGAFHGTLLLRSFVAVHNAALAIFSGVCVYVSWPLVWGHLREYGISETYCDPHDTLWTTHNFGTWAYIFYLSKYYEFVDTWILVLKGKDASFLQVYHHTGIVLCMWLGVLSHSSWLIFVVLLNSFIHTLMYTYFFIKTVSPSTEIKAAKYLTRMQIGQFITGIASSMGVLYPGCDTPSSRFGLMCLHVYGYGLIALFVAFAKRKYKKKVS